MGLLMNLVIPSTLIIIIIILLIINVHLIIGGLLDMYGLHSQNLGIVSFCRGGVLDTDAAVSLDQMIVNLAPFELTSADVAPVSATRGAFDVVAAVSFNCGGPASGALRNVGQRFLVIGTILAKKFVVGRERHHIRGAAFVSNLANLRAT